MEAKKRRVAPKKSRKVGNPKSEDAPSDCTCSGVSSCNDKAQGTVKDMQQNHTMKCKNVDHAAGILDAFNGMRRDGMMCDVILVVDHLEMSTHKMVLAASSPYFYAMFTNFEESKRDRIVMSGIDAQTMELLLQFMYSSELVVTQENVQTLLAAADMLQLQYVCNMCCEFLEAQLHPSNCLGIGAFADLHGCSELTGQADVYAKRNFMEVVECEEFLALAAQHLANLISSDLLVVQSEERVFESVMAWVSHDPARQEQLDMVMEQVRLPLLSDEYLAVKVEEQPLFMASPRCKDMLIEALRYRMLKGKVKIPFQTPRSKPRSGLGGGQACGGQTESGQSSANGSHTIGDFVIRKTDFQNDAYPPLWKVDGKALLCKYVPAGEGDLLYRSTSTYSGWSAAHKDSFYDAPVLAIHSGRNSYVKFLKELVCTET